MKKKILITGAEGYVGSNLKKYFSKDYSIFSLSHKIGKNQKKNVFEADITDLKAVEKVIKKVTPDVLIHTAAVSNLSECEKNNDLAFAVNFSGTKNIVDTINKFNLKTKLIFFSSDYVFDGEKGNYKEEDIPNPKTVYGKSKLQAEEYIKNQLEDYIICRTANIYGRGGNFFNFIVDSLNKNKKIELFNEVFYTPTYIDYLLDCLKLLIEKDFKGLIHIAGPERVSRFEFAKELMTIFNQRQDLISPTKQPQGGLVAKDSSLNSELVKCLLNNYCPSIEKSLHFCFGNLISPYFCFHDERGKMIGICNLKKWKEINYFSSQKGAIRGNHYHKRTLEGFFIIKGKIKVTLTNVVSGVRKKFLVDGEDIFLIKPGILHTFEVIENSSWINFLSRKVDQNDKDFYKP